MGEMGVDSFLSLQIARAWWQSRQTLGESVTEQSDPEVVISVAAQQFLEDKGEESRGKDGTNLLDVCLRNVA